MDDLAFRRIEFCSTISPIFIAGPDHFVVFLMRVGQEMFMTVSPDIVDPKVHEIGPKLFLLTGPPLSV